MAPAQVANARLIIGTATQTSASAATATAALMRSLARAELVNLDETSGLLALDPVAYPGINPLDKGKAITAFFENPPEISPADQQWRTEAEVIVATWSASLANPTSCTPAVDGTSPSFAGPVDSGDIVSVEGIKVQASAAVDLQRLLAAALADGIVLAGWGYRDHDAQIRLRRQHCGSSDYAIYQAVAPQTSRLIIRTDPRR